MFKLRGVTNLERVLFAFENDEFIFNSFGYLFIDLKRPEIILGLL